MTQAKLKSDTTETGTSLIDGLNGLKPNSNWTQTGHKIGLKSGLKMDPNQDANSNSKSKTQFKSKGISRARRISKRSCLKNANQVS